MCTTLDRGRLVGAIEIWLIGAASFAALSASRFIHSVLTMPTVTIVTQWYPPEQAPYGHMMRELATGLVRAGWDVTIVTGFPNHPRGVVFDGWRKRWLHEQEINGVRVCRVWLATFATRSFAARIATFLTFTLTSSWRILRRRPPDVIFAVLQPLTVGLILPAVARLKRARLALNIQDLHPDAQINLGIVKNRFVIALMRSIESYAYRNAAAITAICEPFRRHVIARGGSEQRTFVVENWVDTDRLRPMPDAGRAFREELGFDASHFVALWAGTLGHASGADLIVEAAALLRSVPNARMLIVGEGPIAVELGNRVAAQGLDNVRLRPFEPEERVAAMQSCADVSLVTLAPTAANVSVPSKVLAYLACGRPVIAAVPDQSETAALVRRAEAGVIVPTEPQALAAAIAAMAADPPRARRLGRNARAYASAYLSSDTMVKRYDLLLRRVREVE